MDFLSYFVGFVMGFVCCEIAVVVGMFLSKRKRGRPAGSYSSRGYSSFVKSGKALIGR